MYTNGIYDHCDSSAFCGGDVGGHGGGGYAGGDGGGDGVDGGGGDGGDGDDGGGEGDNYYNVGQSDTSFCYVAQAGRELAMQIRIT